VRADEALIYVFMSFRMKLRSTINPVNVPEEAAGKWLGDTSTLDPRILVEHLFVVIDIPMLPAVSLVLPSLWRQIAAICMCSLSLSLTSAE
jgi:hypothetical protein